MNPNFVIFFLHIFICNKKDVMKNLLSENMLRFRTKNLSEAVQRELVLKSIMETINEHGLHGAVRQRLTEQQQVPKDLATFIENYRNAVIAAFPNVFANTPGKTDATGYILFPGNNPQEYVYVYTNGAVTLPNDGPKLLQQLQTIHDKVVLNGVSNKDANLRNCIANLVSTPAKEGSPCATKLAAFDPNKIIAMNKAFLNYRTFLQGQKPATGN